MCGISGELRFDGRPADVAAVDAHDPGAWRPAGPTARACGPTGPTPSGTGAWPSST